MLNRKRFVAVNDNRPEPIVRVAPQPLTDEEFLVAQYERIMAGSGR